MNSPANIEQTLADFAVTTHILGVLKSNPEIPADGVDVTTLNGCVVLKGHLQWESQVKIVNELVEKIAGVEHFTNCIAIMPAIVKTNFSWSFSAN